MKKTTAICLCAALCALLAACASRGEEPAAQSQPASLASVPSSSQSASLAEEQPSPSQPEPAPEEEEEYPLPELSDADRQLLLDQINAFASSFPDQEGPGVPQDLPEEQVLQFCMQQAVQQKDLYGYYFEEQDGNYLIPAAVIAENAQRSLGLEGFTATGSDLYDPDRDCYRYPLVESEAVRYALASPQGAPEDGISYEVEYLDSQGDTSHVLRFTFQLGRLNGMPYLQLRSWEPVGQ